MVAALRSESILGVVAPGATLEHTTATRAETCSVMGEPSTGDSGVSQGFALDGDPGRAVEAYLAPARAAGWRPRFVACSPVGRSMRAVLTKDVAGFTATLIVTGSDPLPPAARSLAVLLTDGTQSEGPSPGETPGDLHCVRPVAADDPGLRPFAAVPARTAAGLCAILPLGLLQNRLIGVSRAEPEADKSQPACRYLSGQRTALLLRDVSTVAPAVYQDRRLPTPAPAGDRIVFVRDELGPARVGAWLASARGPLLLEMPDGPDDVLLGLAQVVLERAG